MSNGLKLDTEGFRELKGICRKGDLRLLIPKMMERELLRKYDERAAECAEAFKLHPIPYLELSKIPSKDNLKEICLKELKRQWKEFKGHFTIEELPLVGNLEDVVDWYFNYQDPFFGMNNKRTKGQSKEFPDAFIISALESYCKKHQARIAIVSADEHFKNACDRRQHFKCYSKLGNYIRELKPKPKQQQESVDPTQPRLSLTITRDVFGWEQKPEPIDPTLPIVIKDLTEIKAILKREDRVTSPEINRVMRLLQRRNQNYQYFFLNANDSIWLDSLEQDGFFNKPPSIIVTNGNYNAPFWPPLSYLVRVFDSEPEKVLKILENLPETANPRILEGIVDVVLKSNSPDVFRRLAPKIMTYVATWWWFRSDKVIELLKKPYLFDKSIESLSSSLLLKVIEFRSGPQSEEEKQERQDKESESQHVFDDPSPRFDDWEYREILDKGVRPLVEKEPWTVARILIDATASMIRMTMHPEDMDETDGAKRYGIFSDRALDGADYTYMDPDSKWRLVQVMKFSCEKVFEKSSEFIDLLNESLCNQRWKVFRHIREHLYTLYPNEQTKPWIRELILAHKNYDWNYSYHFQKMMRIACEHFGAKLLSEKELERIFEIICNGPSQESSRKRMGEQFTEEEFKKGQRRLHRLLLRPFASVLFGEYLSYFQELENKAEEELSDEDYLRFRSYSGTVEQRSPKPQEELAKMTDEDLLVYINEWNDNHRDEKEPFVDINIEALTREFGNVFKKFIMPNPERLEFWMENRGQIQRPIYVRNMVDAMHEQVKAKNFDNLDKWLLFCEWVLSYYDQSVEKVAKDGQKSKRNDESRESSNWHNPWWSVGDFVETCFKEEVDAPISHRKSLARLLEMLCTQFDLRLDQGKLLCSDLMDEAINKIRSRGLETLVKFGFWVRRHDEEAKVSEVTSILEKRFALAKKRPLTLPEYAMLGAEYPRIYFLDQIWAEEHKLNFFPKDKRKEWLAAFGSFLCWHQPYLPVFEFLREEFVFALENLKDMEEENSARQSLIDVIGQKLFTYYLWEVYPLSGEESLIERYYQETKTTKEQWKSLFTWVGFVLQNHDGNMEEKLLDRFKEFFEWRLDAGEIAELGEFFLWTEAECLEEEWRLTAYSRVLNFIESVDVKDSEDLDRIFDGLESLRGMLGRQTAKVVECFAKMTDIAFKNNSTYFYIPSDDAKAILKAGLESKNEIVIENAKRAQEKLLKMGRFEFLNLDE